jgi:hypothetical protein
MKIGGSGSGSESRFISQRNGSADPDPHQNVMDSQHWRIVTKIPEGKTSTYIPYLSGSNLARIVLLPSCRGLFAKCDFVFAKNQIDSTTDWRLGGREGLTFSQ